MSWFVKYLKDRIFLMLAFFISLFFVIVFYNLTSTVKEFFYPAIIACFLFVMFTSFDFYRYLSFNMRIKESIQNIHYDLEPITEEQKIVSNVIRDIHNMYIDRMFEINSKAAEKERFLSHWIHNLKTPVSVTDLIIQKCESDEIDVKEGLMNIKQENNRIFHTLEQVLNIFRLEEFSRDYVPESMNLVELVRRVINSKKNQFIYSHVYPRLEVSNEIVMVLSDEKWNLLMIDQIISNAIKYSQNEEESKAIYMDISQDDMKTILTIKDEGIGIPSHDLNKVFEPFFTGENGRKYRDSTGIGLYMCSIIAEKLDHELTIDSEVGRGTTVTITYLTKM